MAERNIHIVVDGTPSSPLIAAPTAPSAQDVLWLDTSASPNVLRFYDGTDWVPTTISNNIASSIPASETSLLTLSAIRQLVPTILTLNGNLRTIFTNEITNIIETVDLSELLPSVIMEGDLNDLEARIRNRFEGGLLFEDGRHLMRDADGDSFYQVGDANLIDRSIGETKIQNNAISGRVIASNAIQSRHIANNQITSNHISNAAITTRHIRERAITPEKLARDILSTVWRDQGQALIGSMRPSAIGSLTQSNVFSSPNLRANRESNYACAIQLSLDLTNLADGDIVNEIYDLSCILTGGYAATVRLAISLGKIANNDPTSSISWNVLHISDERRDTYNDVYGSDVYVLRDIDSEAGGSLHYYNILFLSGGATSQIYIVPTVKLESVFGNDMMPTIFNQRGVEGVYTREMGEIGGLSILEPIDQMQWLNEIDSYFSFSINSGDAGDYPFFISATRFDGILRYEQSAGTSVNNVNNSRITILRGRLLNRESLFPTDDYEVGNIFNLQYELLATSSTSFLSVLSDRNNIRNLRFLFSLTLNCQEVAGAKQTQLILNIQGRSLSVSSVRTFTYGDADSLVNSSHIVFDSQMPNGGEEAHQNDINLLSIYDFRRSYFPTSGTARFREPGASISGGTFPIYFLTSPKMVMQSSNVFRLRCISKTNFIGDPLRIPFIDSLYLAEQTLPHTT